MYEMRFTDFIARVGSNIHYLKNCKIIFMPGVKMFSDKQSYDKMKCLVNIDSGKVYVYME
jgi:hypothetical protein